MMPPAILEQRLEKVVGFITPYLRFINCHMVNYFTDNHWENYISPELRVEVARVGQIGELAAKLMKNGFEADVQSRYPALARLMQATKAHSLSDMPDVCLSLDKFRNLIVSKDESRLQESLPIKEFMSPKKNHEVSLMSSIVANLCKNLSSKASTLVIDAGDGKGYLSSRLALEYQLPVLGIDSSQTNTNGAQKRSERLGRAWNTLVDRAEKEKAGQLQKGRHSNKRAKVVNEALQAARPSTDLYKTATQYIDTDTDLAELVAQNFPGREFDSYCLTGLHTCGNLAPNCLNIFRANEKIRVVCNVGCCYHLLDESFAASEVEETKLNRFQRHREDERVDVKEEESITPHTQGFPLSDYLRSQDFFLGRNARMLASQSVSRFFAEQKLPEKSLLYRAMLQVLINKHFTPEESDALLVGKSKSHTFLDYVQKSFKKFNTACPSDEEIAAIETQYQGHWDQMQLFYIIRMLFAPVIETVIVLDRLLYLKENGYDESYVVQIFDPVVSPRCFGIVSLK